MLGPSSRKRADLSHLVISDDHTSSPQSDTPRIQVTEERHHNDNVPVGERASAPPKSISFQRVPRVHTDIPTPLEQSCNSVGVIKKRNSPLPNATGRRGSKVASVSLSPCHGDPIWRSASQTDDGEGPLVFSFGNYQIGEKIGKGGYGKVFRGLNMRNGQFVAIKEVRLSGESLESDLPQILGEIQLLKRLKHTNIVRYIDYHYVHEKSLHIVLEYIENGSLKDTMRKFGSLPEPLTARYINQVLQGLSYLHFRDIIHGDIKCANILITKDGVCKLADFGVATQLNPNGTTSTFGTTYWSAPETLERSEASKASDVWSLGCTVIELMTGRPPYRDLEPLAAVRKILENDLPPFPEDASQELVSFLTSCFQKDPEDRATIGELQFHPWMKKYGRRKSSHPFLYSGGSSEDLHSLFHRMSASPHMYGMDYLQEDELNKLVEDRGNDLIEEFTTRVPEDWKNPTDVQIDVLRRDYCDLQAENRLLLLLLRKAHDETDTSMVVPEHTELALSRVEKAFVEMSSESKLLQTIYNTPNLPIDKFRHGTRGILLMKRATSTGSWKKRWIVLQDTFLLCYKPNCGDENPVSVILMRQKKITPIAERAIGKKNCFMLTCGSNSFYFAAASPEILLKWVTAFDESVAWYFSPSAGILEQIEQETVLKRASDKSRFDAQATPKRSRTIPRLHLLQSMEKKNSSDQPFPGITLHNEGDRPGPGMTLSVDRSEKPRRRSDIDQREPERKRSSTYLSMADLKSLGAQSDPSSAIEETYTVSRETF